jgi:Zn-dependent peptidase ImmA (M78 family)
MSSNPPRVSKARQAAIEALAERIAIARFAGERVDPEQIARDENIGFKYDSFPEEFDGILVFDDGKFYLVCNERRSSRGANRSRFTFAHELGHYFIEEHRRDLQSGQCPPHFSLSEFRSDLPIEKEADIFAANLLMPATSFRKKSLQFDHGMERISALSTVFGTSFTATAFRAMALDTFPAPAAMYCWAVGGTPTPKRWMSPSTFRSGWRFPKGPTVLPERTATAEFIATGAGSSVVETDARIWFPGRVGRVREEVMCLAGFGWVTVVYGCTL